MKAVDLVIPKSWEELSDRQILLVFRLMSMGFEGDQLKLMLLLRLSGFEVIGKSGASSNYILRSGKAFCEVSPMQLAAVLPFLDWVLEPSPMPVLVSRFRGVSPLDPLFQGVPFEKFLLVENFYQGFLSTQSNDFLVSIAKVVYPGIRLRLSSPASEPFLLSVFFWATSLKRFFAFRFCHLFSDAPSESSNLLSTGPQDIGSRLQDAMDAQIRALTKGDVTKEPLILEMDTWRALTELNAQARECAELKAKSKK